MAPDAALAVALAELGLGTPWELLSLALLGAAIGTAIGYLLLSRQLRLSAARPQPGSGPEVLATLREVRDDLRALRGALEPRAAAGAAAGAGDRAPNLIADALAAQAALAERVEASLDRTLKGVVAAVARERELSVVPAPPPPVLSERVTDRLLALGYERVQIVTDSEHLDAIASGDGDVLVEAARQGVLHKGRVRVRNGLVAGVDVHPSYSIFP